MHVPFRHPLASHAAMTVLGYRRNGAPIYAIAGGSGEGDGTADTSGSSADAGQTGQQQNTDGQQAAGAAQPTSSQQAASSDAKDTTDLAATVARLEKDLAAARKEAASSRVNAKETAAAEARAALAQDIGKALGLVKDDTPPDPAKLAEQIGTQTSRIGQLESALRQREVELAVHTVAAKHQAKPSALLDSRAFVKTVRELDPTAKDFTTQLDAAVKAAVTENPSFRSVPPAGRSGADLTGGTGEATKPRTTSLGAAIRGHYGT